ncbi:MAG: hypothetical protein AB8G96_12680 [Phycisphaerales bacterium]
MNTHSCVSNTTAAGTSFPTSSPTIRPTTIAVAATIMVTTSLLAAPAIAAGPNNDIVLVSDFAADVVHRFDGLTGRSLGPLGPGGGLNGPLGIVIGPDQRAYVASEGSDAVLRYDPISGAFLDAFIPERTGGLTAPAGLLFVPDVTGDGEPDLLVTSFDTDRILRFDGVHGTFIDELVASGAGGLDGPDAGIDVGPDGRLYVPSFFGNQILAYDLATGAFDGVFVPPFPGPVLRPRAISFVQSRAFVVSEGADRVYEVDPIHGDLMGIIAEADGPSAVVIGQSLELLVSSVNDARVSQWDLAGGGLIGELVPPDAGRLQAPTFVTRLATQACAADLNRDGTVASDDLLRLLAAWGPCSDCPADLNADGMVDAADLSGLLAAWGPCARP